MHFHRFQLLFAALIALLSATNSSAQQRSAPAQTGSAQQQVLPDSFGTWHSSSCDANAQRPAVSQEAGEREFRQCQFTSGKQTATIWAGKYRDPSSAYEVYTSLLRPTMQPSTVGRFTAVDDKGLLVLVGDVVIGVDEPRNVSTKDLQELTSIIAARTDKTPLPPIREYLPKEDLVNATQRYVLGPVGLRSAAESVGKPEITDLTSAVGFASGAEAMLAQYHHGRDAGVLLLIDYPTPQLAELHSRHLETALSESGKDAGTKIERNGSLLSMVIAPSSRAFADTLRNAVTYHTQVTWNEPSQTATDPSWALVLYRIFFGTGIFMIAAIVLGIAFGGLRVFTKRLLPGKVFDRHDRMEVLQMGLSGKTIDTRDLY
ncbi:MAG: hypothetical protein JWO71_2497 [Candidatus Acidoferrum typicum]|nr:hypothetical protein [Candidatus Acidoferrum typicum]